MQITDPNLDKLRSGFKTNFQSGLNEETDDVSALIEEVSSTTKIETYGFLDAMPNWRKWVGPKRIRSLGEKSYKLENDDFEVTVSVKKTAIEDDNLGLLPNQVKGWGRNSGKLKGQLVFGALRDGHTRECFDGQNFFDTDHPLGDTDQTWSNMSAVGASEPWFLIDNTHALKPILYQNRKSPAFSQDDSDLFKTGLMYLGAEARGGAGYTYPQLAYRSTLDLNEVNYKAARDAMMALKDDEGEPLGIKPTHIVVGVSNWQKAKDLFDRAVVGGTSNTLNGELVIQLAKRLA